MYYKCYTSSTTLYTDITTVVFYHIVLNNRQWSVGFVLNSNDLSSTNMYQQRVLKQLSEGRREWKEQVTRQQQITQQPQQDIEQKLYETQQQLQVSQQQFHQHLLKCHNTIHTQLHQEQRCKSCCDTCNMSSCIFLSKKLFIFLSSRHY